MVVKVRRAAVGILVLVALAVSTFGAPGAPSWPVRYRVDLDVYRIGARAWWDGVALYGPDLPATSSGLPLPFTYPPAAAILFVVLTLGPLWAAGLVTTALSATCALGIVALTSRWAGAPLTRHQLWVLTPAILLAEPVRETISFGQVNLLIAAIACVDCLSPRPRWPRGALTGVVAAIKLTPLVLLLWFVVTRDWRALLTTVTTFLGVTAAAFVLAPRDSVQYWTATLHETNRIGAAWYASNENIAAVLVRAVPGLGVGGPVWFAAAAVVVLLGVTAARRAASAGLPGLGLVSVALTGLLCSPVSWSHHWVWCLPTLVVLHAVARTSGRRGPHILLASGIAVFAVGPHVVVPFGGDVELTWSVAQQLLGSTYVWWSLALLAAVALWAPRWAPHDRASTGEQLRERNLAAGVQ